MLEAAESKQVEGRTQVERVSRRPEPRPCLRYLNPDPVTRLPDLAHGRVLEDRNRSSLVAAHARHLELVTQMTEPM